MLSHIKDLFLRRFATEHHKRAWIPYEKILLYRSNFMQICHTIYYTLLILTGTSAFQQAGKVMDGDMEITIDYDREFAEKAYPYATSVVILVHVTKYILVIASIKNLNVCKSYFYLQMVFLIAENFLVTVNF